MYFKVINKETEAWQRIDCFMTKFQDDKKRNLEEASKFIGIEFDSYLRRKSLFNLAGTITAILPKDNDLSKNKDWKRNTQYPDFFEPNKRTKRGREIAEFLGSQNSPSFLDQNEVFECEINTSWYSFGIKCYDNSILVNAQDEAKFRILDGMIEITYSEYNSIIKENE